VTTTTKEKTNYKNSVNRKKRNQEEGQEGSSEMRIEPQVLPVRVQCLRWENRPGARVPGLEMPWNPGKNLVWVQITQIYSNRFNFFKFTYLLVT